MDVEAYSRALPPHDASVPNIPSEGARLCPAMLAGHNWPYKGAHRAAIFLDASLLHSEYCVKQMPIYTALCEAATTTWTIVETQSRRFAELDTDLQCRTKQSLAVLSARIRRV